MAALTITSTDVKKISGNERTAKVYAGVTVTAGQVVTLNSSQEVVLASTTTAELAGGGTVNAGLFIALSGGSPGQTIALASTGSVIDLGVTGIQGKFLFLDGTSGGIDDSHSALISAEIVSSIGYGNDSDQVVFSPIITGIAIP